MLAAALIGLVQPVGVEEASAQGVFGGANMILYGCAGTTAGPLCAAAGATTGVASRDVLIQFDLGTATGQTWQLLRVTSAGGSFNTTTTFTPIVVGTSGFVRDTVPAGAGQVACYQVLVNGGAARSDFLCEVFGLAQGTVPAELGVSLRQSVNMTVTWQPVAGAAGYLVYTLGTDGVAVVPAN
jgi:hypothetical protein